MQLVEAGLGVGKRKQFTLSISTSITTAGLLEEIEVGEAAQSALIFLHGDDNVGGGIGQTSVLVTARRSESDNAMIGLSFGRYASGNYSSGTNNRMSQNISNSGYLTNAYFENEFLKLRFDATTTSTFNVEVAAEVQYP